MPARVGCGRRRALVLEERYFFRRSKVILLILMSSRGRLSIVGGVIGVVLTIQKRRGLGLRLRETPKFADEA